MEDALQPHCLKCLTSKRSRCWAELRADRTRLEAEGSGGRAAGLQGCRRVGQGLHTANSVKENGMKNEMKTEK